MAESGGHIYTHAQLAPKSRHVAHAVDDGRRKAYIYYAIREVRASDGMLLHATLCEWIIVMFVRAIDDVIVCLDTDRLCCCRIGEVYGGMQSNLIFRSWRTAGISFSTMKHIDKMNSNP